MRTHRIDPASLSSSGRIACFVPSMHIGGAERMTLNLVRGLCRRGIPTDLVLASAEGELMEHVPKAARVIDLGAKRMRYAIRPLARYLRRERPRGVISRVSHTNLAAIAARAIAGIKTRLIVVEASNFSEGASHGVSWMTKRRMMRWAYPKADAVVGVSQGVARDLERNLKMDSGVVHVAYNPVFDDELSQKAAEVPSHRWFQESDGPPNIIAVGRLTVGKDFRCLLEAFAQLRRKRCARLVILGEGSERARLEADRTRLGLDDDVSLPGYVDNPYALMSRAAVLAQSSRFEGLPNVLIEALACGCPVVATDCPSGPAEILDHGKYGTLVQISDSQSLCDALCIALDKRPNRQALRARGQSFSAEKSVDTYLGLIARTDSIRRKAVRHG